MAASASPALKLQIKQLIIESLVLEDLSPEEIPDSALLFDTKEGLGIDSVDALELVMALQKKYSVRIDDQNQSRFIIQSVESIAEFLVGQGISDAVD